jgi:glutaredoxin-dependent peroxiredoxin
MSLLNHPAPDFILYNSSRAEVKLSDLRGQKVLLLFFPAAFTSTCTTELCSVRDDITFYNGMNATVFGISTDALYSLHRYREEQNLNFELLSDFNKEVSVLYNSIHETFNYGMKGVSKRSAFVIDREGIVRYEEIVNTPGTIPDFEKIKQVLQELP